MIKRRPPISPMRDVLANEAAGGIALIAAAALAMLAANLPATAAAYHHWLETVTGPVLTPRLGPMTVHLWINDGLMALFFLLVGLEIKRELIGGELATATARRLPFVAAVAGMIVPALVYLAVTGGAPELRRGWAIPAATDIAFAIGVLSLLGSRVPASLKLLLMTIAIVDDIGAVAIIALAYTDAIAPLPLGLAVVTAGAMALLGRRGGAPLWLYLPGFALLWLFVLQSGVHATIAGVVAAMTVPHRADDPHSPLLRLEHALHPWSAFAIIPLFGFANAGVALDGLGEALASPLVLGIALGLFVGKQIGIFGAIWGAIRLGIAQPPPRVRWHQLYGLSLIAGIGFTMSLFIGGLAFTARPDFADQVRIGVLGGSLLAAIAGATLLSVKRRSA